MMSEFERRSAMMSGRRSWAAPGCPGTPGVGGAVGGVRVPGAVGGTPGATVPIRPRSEEHTSELQSQSNLVCRLLLEKKNKTTLTYSRYREHDSQQLHQRPRSVTQR